MIRLAYCFCKIFFFFMQLLIFYIPLNARDVILGAVPQKDFKCGFLHPLLIKTIVVLISRIIYVVMDTIIYVVIDTIMVRTVQVNVVYFVDSYGLIDT